jgi:hypothetical protein
MEGGDNKIEKMFYKKEIYHKNFKVTKLWKVLGVCILKAAYYNRSAKYFLFGIPLWKIKYVPC